MRTPSIVTSPPVTAARPMKLPTSMWSVPIDSPPPSRSTPLMRSTFDPMPSICAPSETRKRQRSWTCGSHAALPITVSPGVVTAAITAFSVPITLASSRKTGAPRSPSVAISNAGPLTSMRAPSSANACTCGSRRRRPITSPPGGGIVARPKRASSGPASRKDARIFEHSRSSGADFVHTRRVDAHLVLTGPPARRRGPRAGRAWCRRHGCAACSSASPARRASRHAARIGSAPFLLPAARIGR